MHFVSNLIPANEKLEPMTSSHRFEHSRWPGAVIACDRVDQGIRSVLPGNHEDAISVAESAFWTDVEKSGGIL